MNIGMVVINNQCIRGKCLRGCYSQEEEQSKEMSKHTITSIGSGRCPARWKRRFLNEFS